ncbi:MAG: hypothetical protein AAF125_22310, partial [Chloroflexota bacterium]
TLDGLSALNEDVELSVKWLTTPTQMEAFTNATMSATEALVTDTQQQEDSDKWVRHDWNTMQQEASGITYDAQSMGLALTAFAKMGPRLSAEAAAPFFVDATERHLNTATGFGILLARDPSNNTQRLSGGRLWQRMHLGATHQGLAMQPLNQLAERADREAQLGIEPTATQALADLVDDNRWLALMPFRFGYPLQPSLPSPRRPIEAVTL